MAKKLNVKLLRKIQKHILEEPRRLMMGDWKREIPNPIHDFHPPCGTMACIAGWSLLLSKVEWPEWDFIPMRAAELLGLKFSNEQHGGNCDDNCQAGQLFLQGSWPRKFRNRFWVARRANTRAKIACARIDQLIEYGE